MKENAVFAREYGIKMESDCKLLHFLPCIRITSKSRGSIRAYVVFFSARKVFSPSYHHPAIFFLEEFFENAPGHIRHQHQTGQFSRQITVSPRSSLHSSFPSLFRLTPSKSSTGLVKGQPRCPSFHGKAEVKRKRREMLHRCEELFYLEGEIEIL